MKRFQVILGALVAMCALSALMAAAASGATFLLAEWLLNGVAITSNDLVEIEGEILLIDLGTGNDILCSGYFDGWVGPQSLDWVSEVLNLAKEAISSSPLVGLALLCERDAGSCEASTPTVDVYPVGLPWETVVDLYEEPGDTLFFVLFFKAGGGKLGWEVTNCLVLGISVTDECTNESTETTAAGASALSLSGTTLQGSFSEEVTLLAGLHLANCSVGGAEKGLAETPTPGTFIVSGGGELSASSDGLSS
jgi:hypothetical protein